LQLATVAAATATCNMPLTQTETHAPHWYGKKKGIKQKNRGEKFP